MPEETKKIPHSRVLWIAGAVGLAAAGGLLALLFSNSKTKNGYMDGYIISEGEQTDTIEDLFYMSNDQYWIGLQKMEEVLDLDVVPIGNSLTAFTVRTKKSQMELEMDNKTYKRNLNTIQDDDSYLIPFGHEGIVYVDSDILFSTFGYRTEYKTNAEGTIVELTLIKNSGDPYETITLRKEEEPATEPETQVEEGAVNPEQGLNKPGEEELPTVPHPIETKPMTEEEFLAQGETYPEDVQEVIDNHPDKEETPAESQPIIDRPEVTPNRMTDEEFEEVWKESKDELKSVYQNGAAATGTVPFAERGEDFIAFNPMNKAVYYDTISVLHNTADDVFVEVKIASEWSDMARNTDNAETIAFYNGVPAMVQATLHSVLGETEGEELFSFIKEHADKTQKGGYIATHNEHGEVVTVWTDGEVGDGIMSTELDFENWRDRETDDGLRYYAARDGEGICIKVYKN